MHDPDPLAVVDKLRALARSRDGSIARCANDLPLALRVGLLCAELLHEIDAEVRDAPSSTAERAKFHNGQPLTGARLAQLQNGGACYAHHEVAAMAAECLVWRAKQQARDADHG